MGQNYGHDGTRLIKAVYDEDIDEIKECLKDNKKYPIEAVDSGDRTALFWAANKGLADVVKLLLNAGANPDRESSDELVDTPRIIAEKHAEINIDNLANNPSDAALAKKIQFDEILSYFDAYDNAQKTKSCGSGIKSRLNKISDNQEASDNADNDNQSMSFRS